MWQKREVLAERREKKRLERSGEKTSLTKAEEQCDTVGSNKQAILQAFQISGKKYQTQRETQTQK